MDSQILNALCAAASEIHDLMKAGKGLTLVGERNATGDRQLELDIVADSILVKHLSGLEQMRFIASEEREDLIRTGEGKFSITLDPLDGSKAAMFGIPPGTIFGLFRDVDSLDDLHGANVVASGFFVYGAALELFFADEGGYQAMILNPDKGEWEARDIPATLPSAAVLALNAANIPEWELWFQRYYEAQIASAGNGGEATNLRWFGSMVSDVKRLLLQGGLFGYPRRNAPGYENGHLRLIYEAIPMAFLVEKAGGQSSDGRDSLLNAKAKTLHQKTPVFLGEANKITELEKTAGKKR